MTYLIREAGQLIYNPDKWIEQHTAQTRLNRCGMLLVRAPLAAATIYKIAAISFSFFAAKIDLLTLKLSGRKIVLLPKYDPLTCKWSRSCNISVAHHLHLYAAYQKLFVALTQSSSCLLLSTPKFMQSNLRLGIQIETLRRLDNHFANRIGLQIATTLASSSTDQMEKVLKEQIDLLQCIASLFSIFKQRSRDLVIQWIEQRLKSASLLNQQIIESLSTLLEEHLKSKPPSDKELLELKDSYVTRLWSLTGCVSTEISYEEAKKKIAPLIKLYHLVVSFRKCEEQLPGDLVLKELEKELKSTPALKEEQIDDLSNRYIKYLQRKKPATIDPSTSTALYELLKEAITLEELERLTPAFTFIQKAIEGVKATYEGDFSELDAMAERAKKSLLDCKNDLVLIKNKLKELAENIKAFRSHLSKKTKSEESSP